MAERKRRVLLTAELKLALIKCNTELKIAYPDSSPSTILEKLANIFSVLSKVSTKTVQNILKAHENGQEIKDSKMRPRQKSKYFSDFYFKEELSRKIHSFHKQNEHFTIDDLLHFAKEELEYSGGRTTLYKILKSMGFKYKKVDGRKILTESSHLKSKKITFLKKYLQYSQHDQIKFIFLDETWIYQNGSQVRQWVRDGDAKANPSKITSEGKRFTVLHAGCTDGFLEGCNFLLDSKIEHRDYHRTMTGEVFKRWVENQLIPALNNLSGKIVVVMDNAPYHSIVVDKLPTSNSSKCKLQNWLRGHQIHFDESLTKRDLWNQVKPHIDHMKCNRQYEVDQILSTKGYEVLRLPPYHCQYNPIEMVWGFCKTYYNKHVRSQPPSKEKVPNLWKEALSKYTPDMWAKSVTHCEKLIRDDWHKLMGNFSIENIPPIIISLAESDFNSDSDDLDSDNDTDLENCKLDAVTVMSNASDSDLMEDDEIVETIVIEIVDEEI